MCGDTPIVVRANHRRVRSTMMLFSSWETTKKMRSGPSTHSAQRLAACAQQLPCPWSSDPVETRSGPPVTASHGLAITAIHHHDHHVEHITHPYKTSEMCP